MPADVVYEALDSKNALPAELEKKTKESHFFSQVRSMNTDVVGEGMELKTGCGSEGTRIHDLGI